MLSGPSAWRRLQAWPMPHASGHCVILLMTIGGYYINGYW